MNVDKSFGSGTRVVFPMVMISTLWTGGGVVTSKFRGWDVNVSGASTKLAATSGNGD